MLSSTQLPYIRDKEPTPQNIRALVDTFYARVRDDGLLGPIFERELAGRWDAHLATLANFWSSLVLGTKTYRGHVQRAHQPLTGIEPAHFNRWLTLFLQTVEARYTPAAARRFMEPALRIAHSLQLSHFGWEYRIPAEQQAILDHLSLPVSRHAQVQDAQSSTVDTGNSTVAHTSKQPAIKPDA